MESSELSVLQFIGLLGFGAFGCGALFYPAGYFILEAWRDRHGVLGHEIYGYLVMLAFVVVVAVMEIFERWPF